MNYTSLSEAYQQMIDSAICAGHPELATNYIQQLHTIAQAASASTYVKPEPTITLGSTTITEDELKALKELLKFTNPELYI